MLSSMTGFSRINLPKDLAIGSIELRSLNHKQLDISLRISEIGKSFEEKARKMLKENFYRGRIDCNITIEKSSVINDFELNTEALKSLFKTKGEIELLTKKEINSSLIEILRWPGICQPQQIEEVEINKILEASFKDAIDHLKESRYSEGRELTKIIKRKLVLYTQNFHKIRQGQPQINKDMIEKFKERILELTQSCDTGRLEQECAILMQKMDVVEEIDRIDYHLETLNSILKEGGVVGRKFGFILHMTKRFCVKKFFVILII